jgi:hypothetical protein
MSFFLQLNYINMKLQITLMKNRNYPIKDLSLASFSFSTVS